MAALVLRRLAPFDVSRGLEDAGPLTGPVTAEEAGTSGLPAGTVVPAPVRAVVTAARIAPQGGWGRRGPRRVRRRPAKGRYLGLLR
ncbi:hypothetical protein [Streptomyces sp. NPDC001502]|uniref:hypothetical protein n=1 Tax=Streptomyces sp. NPDC001502 TaxID=3364578 RepID=UPI00367B1EC7